MNLYHLTKSQLLLLALALGNTTCKIEAAPIEQIGDRYIIHVEELDLRGDESLMDILMMCPDVITLDGKTTLASDPLANLYGKYAIRFDNVEYGLDYNTLLHNLKAREIEKIQVCMNADVMKGTGSQKKVIDIQLRKDTEEGKKKVTGRLGLFGDTYGGAEGITSVRYDSDKLHILSHVEGNMQRSAIDGTPTNHRSHEGAKLNLIWDISQRDNLEITATQTYTRNRLTDNPADYTRYYNIEIDYLRTLADNGANMFMTLASDHENANHNCATSPYTILEFNFPLFTPNLWITTGFEGGIICYNDGSIQSNLVSDYEDFYVQADLKLGKWGFMVGDRFRLASNNAYTMSAYCHTDKNNTLQASYSQQFTNAELGDYDQKPVHVAELKHTYQKKSFILSSMVRHIDQYLYAGHNKTFCTGSTLFWHTGILRLTLGINNYWEKSHFAIYKVAPQLSLPGDWRLTATMLWSSHRPKSSLAYAPANLYAEAAVYKTFGRHWLLEARYHDIASQHLGNRAATIGCTYYF